MGILGDQKIKSPGNVLNYPENQYNLFLPIPPWGGGFQGGGIGGPNCKSSVNVMNCEKIDNNLFTPPPKGVAVGILGGQKIRSRGNVLNCREK